MSPATRKLISAVAPLGLFPLKRIDVLADRIRVGDLASNEVDAARKRAAELRNNARRLSFQPGREKKAEQMATNVVSVFEALAISQRSPENIFEHAGALAVQAEIMARRANSLKEADRFALLRVAQAIYENAGDAYTQSAELYRKNGELSKARDAFRGAFSAFNSQSGTLQSIYLYPASLAAATKATKAEALSRQ